MRSAVLAVLLVLCALPVFAQTPVTAATGIGFSDADHNAQNADGTPVIAKYELRFQPTGACGTAVAPVNLNKPTPDAQGLISVKPIPQFGTIPANCTYLAVIAAIGPTGLEGVSTPTVPFWRVVIKIPASPSQPVLQP